MTNLGPLTTTFTATGPDCTSTYLGANNDNEWIQYGQPNTTQCVPPNFTAFDNYYYSPGICPSGYTYACSAGLASSVTQATCCPVGYYCRDDFNRDTDPFACASSFYSDTYFSAMFYHFTSETGVSTTGPVSTLSHTTTWFINASSSPAFYVEAYGPIVRRSAGDPEWGTTATSDPGSAAGGAGTATATAATSAGSGGLTGAESGGGGGGSSTGSGLSVGASVGIGVGVGLGCIVFIGCIAAAYIIGRRRRRGALKEEAALKSSDVTPYGDAVPVEGQVAELNSGWRPWELQAKEYRQVVEMDGQGHRSELGSNSAPVELPGEDSPTPPPSGYYGHERN
ncbi:hypothetical protein VMCG_07243 [Cytospora schulzeri]|uniref:Uncharacterized protein n=1 Tax=Cytospora schulzeri TaxID=448051 RepID=A0A423WAH3_9PEZI|nr:hypothetical protein VMCG_07243 [Valsa malicola]